VPQPDEPSEGSSRVDPVTHSDPYRVAALWALFGLILVAGLTIWAWTPGMTILGDEWRYAEWTATEGAIQRGFNPDVGKYAIPVPLVVYQGLFEVFGLDSYAPYRVMALVLLATVTVLLFVLVRRRLGSLLALPLTALVLFLGTSSEVVATSLRSPALISLAASLGALLLLERPGRLRDAWVPILLLVAVASHPGGLAFCAAAAIIVFGDERGWRARFERSWIFAIPLVVFLVFLQPGADNREETVTLGERIAEAPGYLLEGVVGLVSHALGVSTDNLLPLGDLGGVDSPIGWLFAIALSLGIVAAMILRKPFPTVLVAYATCALLLIGGALLAPGGTREPNLDRYVLPATVMLIATFAELVREPRWFQEWSSRRRRLVLSAGGALLAFAIASNAATLELRAGRLSNAAINLRAEALGRDLARDLTPVSDAALDKDELQKLVGRNRMPLLPSDYYSVSDEYGSPAFTLGELESDHPETRQIVQRVLEYVATEPVPSQVLSDLTGTEPEPRSAAP